MNLKEYFDKKEELEQKHKKELEDLEKDRLKDLPQLFTDGEKYWRLNDCLSPEEVTYKTELIRTMSDSFSFNTFKTEEEAKYEYERLVTFRRLSVFSKKFEKNKDNFCIKYDVVNKELGIYNNYYYVTGELCFASEKDVQDAIEFVGEYRVLKYYLGVEEK